MAKDIIGLIALAGLVLTPLAAWVTHVVWTVKLLASGDNATVGQMLLGAGGSVIPPLGIIHGFTLWFS